MKIVNFLETSFTAGLTKKLNAAYKDSLINRSIEKFIIKIKICFRYSFLGRITEIDEENNPEILYNSSVIRWLLNIYNVLKNKIVNYANSSIIMSSAVEVKKVLYLSPVKTGGMVVFMTILTNMLLSLFLHEKIGMLGWSMRGMLLVVGFWGIFCGVEWKELKKTSWFIGHVEEKRLLRPAVGGTRNDQAGKDNLK